MKPLYISFYTRDTGYARHAAELVATLERFGLEHVVRGVETLGAWQDNCHYKTRFLRDLRREFPTRPLVWVDADARVRRMPVLFDTLDCDLAAVWKDGAELLTGTLFLGTSPRVNELLDRAVAANYAHPTNRYGDQLNFQNTVEAFAGLCVERLPPSYAAIFDAGMCPPDETVIEHLQASRTLSGGL